MDVPLLRHPTIEYGRINDYDWTNEHIIVEGRGLARTKVEVAHESSHHLQKLAGLELALTPREVLEGHARGIEKEYAQRHYLRTGDANYLIHYLRSAFELEDIGLWLREGVLKYPFNNPDEFTHAIGNAWCTMMK